MTGATGWIGAEIARDLASGGAAVVLHGRRDKALATLADELASAGARVVARTGDTRDAAHLEDVVALAGAELGPIDTVVTAAGGDGFPSPSVDFTPQRFREVVESELTSTYLTIRAVLPGMLDAGAGVIVTIGSTSGLRASSANVAYDAAKAGVVLLTKHLAKEYGGAGIRANCVVPAMTRNERIAQMEPSQVAAIGRTYPLGRIGEPGDIAAAVAHLVSDRASWTTGAVLEVTGGALL